MPFLRNGMPQGNPFAADLLERGAAGYAGYASTLMVERDPELRDRLGRDGTAAWRSHLTQRVLELAAAVAAGEPQLFLGRVTWSRKAFRARGQTDGELTASLRALRDILAEKLPPPAAAEPLDYLDRALAVLAGPPPAADSTELDPARPEDQLALRYLQLILEGNAAQAIRDVAAAAANGLGPRKAYLEVLLPAQREVGRLWHLGEISVAEEHMVTSTTQRTMAVLATQAEPAPGNGRTVVVAAVAGNIHDIGLRALADLYQLAGWRVIYAGSDVPVQDLPLLLTFFEADLLMLGATLATHVPRVQQTIAAIRARCERPVKVIVGGAAFDEAAGLWQSVGGDGYAPTLDQAVTVGARLVGLAA